MFVLHVMVAGHLMFAPVLFLNAADCVSAGLMFVEVGDNPIDAACSDEKGTNIAIVNLKQHQHDGEPGKPGEEPKPQGEKF